MSDVKRLAESIQYHEEKRFHKLAYKPAELELCGKGRSAYVFFYIKKDGKKMALKVFFFPFLSAYCPQRGCHLRKNFLVRLTTLRFMSLGISIF
ncbi:hypothetical protein BsIDN1_48100 [Bacillus safensis]|uniref:Uncharacterized protein n=1 Tax=Bacillus safensis TaxID=561879 RepID=A0A5S9MF01_BACIA|nr:hypothetical protein BsIDN1_48100 [Bacillus safensis]